MVTNHESGERGQAAAGLLAVLFAVLLVACCCCCSCCLLLVLLMVSCRSDKVLLLLKEHIYAMTSRINTLTGVAYKDDPAIMGYNLFNEPRYERHCCTTA